MTNYFKINYKLSKPHICNQEICIKQSFLLVQNLKEETIFGTPFLNTIYPITKVDS